CGRSSSASAMISSVASSLTKLISSGGAFHSIGSGFCRALIAALLGTEASLGGAGRRGAGGRGADIAGRTAAAQHRHVRPFRLRAVMGYERAHLAVDGMADRSDAVEAGEVNLLLLEAAQAQGQRAEAAHDADHLDLLRRDL